MTYDIGKITRELQQAFRLFKRSGVSRDDVLKIELADVEGSDRNLATPENLEILLRALDQITTDVMAARATMSNWLPDAAILAWDSALVQWRGRLGAYHDAVNAAPEGDRAAVLWNVTAPVLLGYFGGEASKLPQQPLDAVTPFMLANQLAVDDAWRDERWRLFKEDLAKGFKEFAVAIGGAAVVVAIGVAGYLIARGLSR